MKQVIVLCGHRSGSSAVAGVLHYLGVNMGDNLMPATGDNPRGYFEDTDFVWLNHRILNAKRLGWLSVPKPEYILSIDDETLQTLRKIAKSFIEARSGIWGFKDPRTAITIPAYWDFFENPHLVVVERNHKACAESLNKRDGIPIPMALDFTRKYYRRIHAFVHRQNCHAIQIRYEHLLRKPDYIIERLSKFIGIQGEVPEDFIDASLCHH